MNTFKIGFENGDSLVTRMNATLEEAQAYYLGNIFNLGGVSDDLQKCNSVELVKPLNPMCERCDCLGADCKGTTEQTWTGCVYRKTEGKR